MKSFEKLNPEYVGAVLATVNSSPYLAHVGLELAASDFDTCRVELEVAAHHLQPFGIAHGGVLAALIDTATFWAAFMRLPAGTGLVNVDLKLNYLKAVTKGRLIAEGKCLRAGRQISYSEASVHDWNGELVAHGTSTLVALPGKDLQVPFPKFLD